MKKRHIFLMIMFIGLFLVGALGIGAGVFAINEYGDPTNGASATGPVQYLPNSTAADFESLIDQRSDQNEFGMVVELSQSTHEISPLIYGVNFSDIDTLNALNIPLRRWGGNATTRYNWKTDVSNRASDWFFLNYPNENADPASLPRNSAADRFVGETLNSEIAPIITVSMIGWTPRGREQLCAFPVSVYGQQQSANDDCGNGISQEGELLIGNDPALTSEPISPEFNSEWVAHLQQQFGTAGSGGVQLYNLDNEPMLWHKTHRDVHPDYVDYAEIRDRTVEYAVALKQADPDAKTLGPVLWGWTAYQYSAADIQDGSGRFDNPDRDQYGDQLFVEWYLEQMRLHEEKTGQRILDYLDLHYYSQIESVSLSEQVDAEAQRLRLNATRSLWDPSYRDESWINKPIALIPNMHSWIDAHYPGTGTAITEYNFGAMGHINGALAQADALGIFGRERLDIATMWDPPTLSQPAAFAFRMYRNYDGNNGTFGELSLPAATLDQNRVAIYAARRQSDNAVTVMLINKSSIVEQVAIDFNGEALSGKSYQHYRYSAAFLAQIEQLPDGQFGGNALSLNLEPQSIQLIVIQS